MPSRKKDRGKQRKAAKQKSKPLHVLDRPGAASLVRELKAEGCCIVKNDGGGTDMSHPSFLGGRAGKSISDLRDGIRNFDRGQMTEEQTLGLAENYVYCTTLHKS